MFENKVLIKKVAIGVVASIVGGVVIWSLGMNYPVIKSKDRSLSWGDIRKIYNASSEVARIRGEEGPSMGAIISSMKDVEIYRSVLVAVKVGLPSMQEASDALKKASPYRGITKKEEANEKKYEQLFVEPVVVGRVAGEYWLNSNSASRRAAEAMKVASTQGFEAAVAANGKDQAEVVRNATIPATAIGKKAMEEARKNALFQMPIVDGAGYSIMYVTAVNNDTIVADLIVFRHDPIGKFYQDAAKAAGITVKCSPSFLCGNTKQ